MKNSLKQFLYISLIIYLPSCAVLTPASHKQIAPGKYSVVAYGNIFESKEGLQKKIDAKAKKLCKKNRYTFETVHGDFDVKTRRQYVNGQMMDVNSIRLARILVCARAAPSGETQNY